MPCVPWLAVGDFNVIKSMEERSDFYQGMPSYISSLEFQNCLFDTELLDMHHDGPIYTWTKKRTVGFVAKKLDIILVNTCWVQSFPDLIAEFCPPEFSGHCAGQLKLSNRTVVRRGPFKFFNYLVHHKNFLQVVHDVWSSSQPYGTQM